MIRGVAAAASDSTAAHAAQSTLDTGASAADAIIAGFLAASGAHAGVLLSPAVVLVAGTGVGARVFDGRSAQPGRGAARPRGYVDEAAIPDAARFPVPRALAMLALLHTYVGRAKLRDLSRFGVTAAEKQGALRRAETLRRIGDSGVLALRTRDVERSLLGRGGAVAGGSLTPDDLTELRPTDEGARTSSIGDQAIVIGAPWDVEAGSQGEARSLDTEVVVACDGRGIVAALAYTPASDGIVLEDLELTIGREAIPVRRGVPRVAPGTPLGAPSPIAILTRGGGFWAAIALPGQGTIDPSALANVVGGMSIETTLSDIRARTNSRSAFAVVRDARDARSVVSA